MPPILANVIVAAVSALATAVAPRLIKGAAAPPPRDYYPHPPQHFIPHLPPQPTAPPAPSIAPPPVTPAPITPDSPPPSFQKAAPVYNGNKKLLTKEHAKIAGIASIISIMMPLLASEFPLLAQIFAAACGNVRP